MGLRGEVRRVCFNQNVRKGQSFRYVADGLGFGIGDVAGEGDEEAHVEAFLGVIESAGEAVEDAAEADRFPSVGEDAEAIVPGVAAVDDDGEIRGLSEFHLLAEDCFLDVAGGMVVEIVEADFAPGDYFGMFGEDGKGFEMGGSDFLCVMGMDAYSGVDPVVGFGVGDGGGELFRAWADGEDRGDACGLGALEHGFTVFGELGAVDVGVGIDEFHG